MLFWLVSSDFHLIVPSHECHWALFMRSHHCFRNGLVPSANKPLPPGITWANVDPDLCHHIVLLSRMSYSQTHDPSLLLNIYEAETKWLPLCTRHVQIHFLERDTLISIKISLTLLPRNDHFQHWFRWWLGIRRQAIIWTNDGLVWCHTRPQQGTRHQCACDLFCNITSPTGKKTSPVNIVVKQNDCYFVDDIFKFTSSFVKLFCSSLGFVFKGPINDMPELIKIMVRRWSCF